VIGGSGLARLAALEAARPVDVRTPWGAPSGPLVHGRLAGRAVVFLARHGPGHTLAPHEIDYRANIRALADAGVHEIVSIASVGGITPELRPGTIAVPDQLLDYTWGRASSFGDPTGRGVVHIDFTHPFTPALRQRLIAAAGQVGLEIVARGTYATTQGPRLETAAEIDRLERDGATMVGMTAMPEAALAREAGLAYATLAVVVNAAAGRADSAGGIALDAIAAVLDAGVAQAVRIVEALAGEATDGGA
jgi:5'-methylthioadenosine phosphorylase